MKPDAPLTLCVKPEIVYTLTAIARNDAGEVIRVRKSDELHNVFTDYGVEAMFGATTGDTTSTLAGVVGTGNATPTTSDITLQGFLAGRYTSGGKGSATFVDNGDGTGYVQSVWTTVFPVGVATGIISEVGSCFRQVNPTSSTPVCSRALVLDGAGSPTSFEVLADEELQLTQYFRRHFSLADQTTVLSENGNDHTVAWRPWALNAINTGNYWVFPGTVNLAGAYSMVGYSTGGTPVASLSPVTNSSTLTVAGGTGNSQSNTAQGAQGTSQPYVAGSKKQLFGMRMPTGSALLISWGTFNVWGIGCWQYTVTPHVTKSALHRYTMWFEFVIDNTP